MKKFLLIVSVFFSLAGINAQGFNGTIEFKYANEKDTTLNVYTVKNKQVRIDQYNKKNSVDGSFLIDLTRNEVKFLNPKRKVWGFQKSETPQIFRGQCVVSKGNSTKTIAGARCTEYIVKNTEENTIITYWITDGKFTFFAPMVKLLNKKDKQNIYYAQIKGLPEGSMPLLSEERQISDNQLLTRFEATKVLTANPPEASFIIPEGYTKFD